MRRLRFPREFSPGCGHGTIETPSGELVAGKHPAAWPYETWQRIVEAKAGQYRRPRREAQRRAHEFSRIIVCSGCRRPLRATAYDRQGYYRDTRYIRKLPCPAFGALSVPGSVVVTQFGQLLAGVHLPDSWREAIIERCSDGGDEANADHAQQRRADLEAEQKRLIQAFAKGYLGEADLDMQVERIRAELQVLPPVGMTRTAEEYTEAAITAGETLEDMAGYWDEALPEKRRDIVWSLLQLEGLVYDLERRTIVAFIPRPDLLPVLALGLSAQWEQRENELHLRPEFIPPKLERSEMTLKPDQRTLVRTEREEALQLLTEGKTRRQVADHFHVSRMAIWRLAESHPRRDGLVELEAKGGDA